MSEPTCAATYWHLFLNETTSPMATLGSPQIFARSRHICALSGHSANELTVPSRGILHADLEYPSHGRRGLRATTRPRLASGQDAASLQPERSRCASAF